MRRWCIHRNLEAALPPLRSSAGSACDGFGLPRIIIPWCAKTRPIKIRNEISYLARSRNLLGQRNSHLRPRSGTDGLALSSQLGGGCRPPGISLLVEMNSLLLLTGNRSLLLRIGLGISVLIPVR